MDGANRSLRPELPSKFEKSSILKNVASALGKRNLRLEITKEDIAKRVEELAGIVQSDGGWEALALGFEAYNAENAMNFNRPEGLVAVKHLEGYLSIHEMDGMALPYTPSLFLPEFSLYADKAGGLFARSHRRG